MEVRRGEEVTADVKTEHEENILGNGDSNPGPDAVSAKNDEKKLNSLDDEQLYSFDESLSSAEGVSQADEYYSAKDFHLVNQENQSDKNLKNAGNQICRLHIDEILIETCLIKQKNYDIPIEQFKRDVLGVLDSSDDAGQESNLGQETEESCPDLGDAGEARGDRAQTSDEENLEDSEKPRQLVTSQIQTTSEIQNRSHDESGPVDIETPPPPCNILPVPSPAPETERADKTLEKTRTKNKDNIEYDSLNSDNYSSGGSTDSVDRIGLEWKETPNNETARHGYQDRNRFSDNRMQACSKCKDDTRVIFNEFKPSTKTEDNRLSKDQPVKLKLSNLENEGSMIKDFYNFDVLAKDESVKERFLKNEGCFKDSLENDEASIKENLLKVDDGVKDNSIKDNLLSYEDSFDSKLLKDAECVKEALEEVDDVQQTLAKKDDNTSDALLKREDQATTKDESTGNIDFPDENRVKDGMNGSLPKDDVCIVDTLLKSRPDAGDAPAVNYEDAKNNKQERNGGNSSGDRTEEADADRLKRTATEDADDKQALTDFSLEKRSSLFRKMSTLPLGNDADNKKGDDTNSEALLEDAGSNFSCRSLLAQILAVSAKNSLALNFGMSVGFQTIAIPSLAKPDNEIYLDQQQISLYGSLFYTVIPLGCLLSGPTIHGWGRKPAMMVFCLPLLVGWLVYYFAMSPAALYTAIIIMGLVNGLLEAPILTYVAEVTEAKWRGMLASSSIVAALFGVFLQMLFGNLFTWRTTAAVNAVFPVLSFLAVCLVPESPHWLASKGRVGDVEKALMWLRGWVDRSAVAAEVDELMAAHNQPRAEQTPLSCHAYASRTFVEPFFIVIGSFAIGHFSGMATVQTYSVSIFDNLGVQGWSWTAAMGASQVLGATTCVILLPLFGKRPIAVASMVGVAVGMAGAATTAGTTAASALLLANFCTNACSRVVPWVLIGEVFTNEMRAVASGLSSCVCYVMAFILSYTYLQVEAFLSLRVLLGVYSAVGLLGSVGYYLFLPETEGKSLAQVQQHFARKNCKGTDNPAFEKDKP